MEEKRINGTALALGNFDGLHKGHMAVLEKTVNEASCKNLKPCVLLFDVHPKKVLSGKRPAKLISDKQRDAILQNMGIEIIKVSFEEFKDVDYKNFLSLIIDKFNVKVICCGYNYHYGKNALGNVQTLKKDCEKNAVDFFALGKVTAFSKPISSTGIRKEIENGNIERANFMLSREFSYCLEVVSGDKRGRLLGFPTINQFFEDDFVKARFGVYASKVNIDGVDYPAVTNIGVRPTINTKTLRSETCILGYNGNLYGREIEVKLLSFLRDEKKFNSLEELSAAIKYDANKAKEIYKRNDNMKKTEIKAVFFDFDDTLQSRKGAYRLYCEHFLSKYFPEISEEERLQKLDEMEDHVDGGYKDREVYFPEMIELWKWENHPPLQELYDSFNYDFGKFVVLLDGAKDVLVTLKERGYIVGAITNGVSSLQNTKLDTAKIRGLFDVVVVSGDIGIYKPDRRIFDEAVRRAGVKNEEALFVGDHPINDIEGALGADMQVIRMNYGDFKGKGLNKDGVLAEIEDIREVLNYLS